ncbi:MAG: glycosyltransferase family 2 protein [Thermoanaerobaculaceae bacterium]
MLKTPAGPSKGAALAWLVSDAGGLLAETDAILIVDVGSQAGPGLFDALAFEPGVDGLQTRLAGTGAGAGLAVAHSERVGQEWEDRGRQAVGWSVRLRGTGSALTPRALAWVAPRLRTRIEDLEATLLLASAGYRIELAEAEVRDDKPALVADAARQRARWLAGRLHLALRHPVALGKLLLRRPDEGLAFAVELMSRPLSLTAPLRLLLAAALTVSAVAGTGRPGLEGVVAAILAASVVCDLAILRLAGSLDWRSAAKLVSAWVGAVVLAPRALWRWTRVRR